MGSSGMSNFEEADWEAGVFVYIKKNKEQHKCEDRVDYSVRSRTQRQGPLPVSLCYEEDTSDIMEVVVLFHGIRIAGVANLYSKRHSDIQYSPIGMAHRNPSCIRRSSMP